MSVAAPASRLPQNSVSNPCCGSYQKSGLSVIWPLMQLAPRLGHARHLPPKTNMFTSHSVSAVTFTTRSPMRAVVELSWHTRPGGHAWRMPRAQLKPGSQGI